MIRSTLALCMLTSLCSCSSVNQMEIKAVSGEVVSLAESDDVWPYFDKTKDLRRSEVYLLKLNFESQKDLREIVLSEQIALFPEVSLCNSDGTQRKPVHTLRAIKRENIFINRYVSSSLRGEEATLDPSGMQKYNTFIPLAGKELARIEGGFSKIDKLPFLDIQTSHEDICLRLGAVKIWVGTVGQSNTSVLPRKDIDGTGRAK